jgi:hypothetical protein
VLALVGWLLAGPRPRVLRRDALLALVWPVAWLAWTLTVGALSGWYPYPFLDIGAEGAGGVALTCVGVTVLFVLLAGALAAVDRRMPPSPGRGTAPGPAVRAATAE